MKVYKVKFGYIPDCSSGFGFILTYPVAVTVAAVIAAGYIYALARLGVIGSEEGEDKS
ncbi:hypothetical protein Ferp_0329 [Ferroglobus placidus DSM 10642]|uniref:Uncharacterized protein n=1 Tax=Ferroglobus placidus (strain DSM 10642 / AEDII12DO) TaxID=589924 RepID=D3S2H8_FERPA|nr:hypothetical protein [Ferroglobus placidus]ADC64508.1 hypothetical protein Ferp_0329 [Ferroglobus placidus DSM 10642]